MKLRQTKFRVGQVVSVIQFYGNFQPGQTGPGYNGKRGQRHGWVFGKIVQINPRWPGSKATAPLTYFLDGWYSSVPENWLRSLNKREIGKVK